MPRSIRRKTPSECSFTLCYDNRGYLKSDRWCEWMNWEAILAPYSQAVEELKIKLKGMRSQYEHESRHSPIEFITGRGKPIESILEKAEKKQIPLEQAEKENQDNAGGRGVYQYVDHSYEDIKWVRS